MIDAIVCRSSRSCAKSPYAVQILDPKIRRNLAFQEYVCYIRLVNSFSPMTAEMCCCAAMCCAQMHFGVRNWLG
jgi:hypothetical protein